MNRLVQGDVGCGKTIVAVMMSLLMVKAGFQVAVMVPTEVLAGQHFSSFKEYLMKYGVNIELLTGSLKKKDRDDILYRLINNRINIIIGTHSLISDNVLFSHLGLVIIDEQHRFGVNQRIKLIDKYKDVDSMFLSATPIPRTLGLTLFKDLDMSSIKTMPDGRKPVVTKVIDQNRLKALFKSIENHLSTGEQAYIVVPLVNENEDYNYIDIKTCEGMVNEYLPDVSYEIVHGRMKARDKEIALASFKNGKVKILISTTVIEVGINVPNATMMIILNSDRFGLATLHQLRGRVGRGSLESYCMLVTNNPENERLQALEKYSSGFDVSEMDFRLRGPGDYLGEDQSGFAGLEYSDFEQDIKILICAKDDSTLYLPRFISGELKSSEFNKIISKSANELDKIN
ncbi:MAG: DEAD/DEAH box helicase [Acholeplasmatales bacterium]|nr:DEAD/DEAH box helicase [Acholeplasmatales bacterium]